MMILCYLPLNLSDTEKQKRIDFLVDKYQMFFLSEEDIITSTETNQKSLRLILKKSHISLFWIKSLEEIPFTPTQISELILFFIPCVVGLINYHDLFVRQGLQIILAVVLGTLCVMLVTAYSVFLGFKLERQFKSLFSQQKAKAAEEQS